MRTARRAISHRGSLFYRESITWLGAVPLLLQQPRARADAIFLSRAPRRRRRCRSAVRVPRREHVDFPSGARQRQRGLWCWFWKRLIPPFEIAGTLPSWMNACRAFLRRVFVDRGGESFEFFRLIADKGWLFWLRENCQMFVYVFYRHMKLCRCIFYFYFCSQLLI